MRWLTFSQGQPSQPRVFIVLSPYRCVASPQARDFVVVLPVFQRGVDRLLDGSGEVAILALDLGLCFRRFGLLELYSRQQFGEGVVKKLDAVLKKFFGHLDDGNAGVAV